MAAVTAGSVRPIAADAERAGEFGRPHCRSVFSYYMQLRGGHLMLRQGFILKFQPPSLLE
jgi:hypothetical protein